ncbi:unnamed protein product [Candida verbasci]|uniref:Vacuolar protein sorting-associated protein VTA1 n=1 Tax=Candida verbasci TaxID=1227364 RepID=A0A9W4TX28_9ASCO|nr:unnamed protein product [Candida verbasci]
MTINLQSIPEQLKSNKNITPYIIRSIDLGSINPIVSYYCKIYVLEYILQNKLHMESKENEGFTVELLDDTESMKKNEESLQEKQVSLVVVLSFAYKLFNQCLQDLKSLTKEKKQATVKKFQAALNFLNILSVFQNSEEIDWQKVSKVDSWDEFDKLNKEKIKVLKFQLSKLFKDEIPYVDEVNDEDLEKELDQELKELEADKKEDDTEEVYNQADDEEEVKNEEEVKDEEEEEEGHDLKMPGAPNDLPKFIDDEDSQPNLPGAPDSEPKFIDDDENGSQPILPGAPHFSPQVSDSESDFKLPGAPKYLPDDEDELSHINKTSSIHVYQPNSNPKKEEFKKPSISRNVSHSHHQLSKNDIKQILDKEDSINVIKKNIKFANSALTFDDLDECERQLEDAIKLMKALKAQEDE